MAKSSKTMRSKARAYRRRPRQRNGPAERRTIVRRGCIAYGARTGARCPRLALRAGWRGSLALCGEHARGLAALMAMVASPSTRERLAIHPWRWIWEVPNA